ncbi:Putative Elongator protein 2 [[Torrubiella] hemipterigena]|uniref:Elongator complex protein 2 n=1 Tax=[Torrubiella] hemipterigena TaxID=1531966 RepID=A0A0A1SKY8_9HYPO|nr:Putative Elongator protein 2 [[Torrubiella] hemipterigena]
MAADKVGVEYLSAGANRQTAVADWAVGGILAFGADSNIAIWKPSDPSARGISRLLGGHTETVKTLAFLPSSDADSTQYLVSGSDDKTLKVWKSAASDGDFTIVQSSAEHTGPINCITTLQTQTDKWIIASGAADATIKIWTFDGSTLQLVQSIKTTPKYFALCISLTFLDDSQDVLVLACAGTKDSIQILTSELNSETIQFTVQATLRGHEGWIRSLSFAKETSDPKSDLLLASASQDKYVRIWRLHQGKELPAAAATGADPSSEAYLPGRSPANKAHWLNAAGKDFSVTFEALLLGHEDWIYSVRWHMHPEGKLQLLSTSADNSLAIWEADPSSGIWVSMVRLGEISREKGATTATGSTGGFWTGLWSPDGTSVACLGRTGSWRRWEYDNSEDRWKPCVSISGHTKAVTGISWSKNGEYLLSTSSDQTTRLHAKWTSTGTWHEMSRPQIHGYDLNCIDSLGAAQFVSGADEKLMRVFSTPKAVASMLHQLAAIGDNASMESMPDAANMPVLGLSNKAIDAVDEDAEIQSVDDRDRDAMDPATMVKKSYLDIQHPPFEETLSRHTLWPETEKLYGHGYEISCLAASHDGKLIASACKASSLNHAVIRLFETERWTELRPPLAAHTLTATRLRFSTDDKYLLSVGRDRQWAVFVRQTGSGDEEYSLLQANPKGHTRMILDCAWAPAADGKAPLFATAGRDKQVRIWTGMADAAGKLQFTQTATIPTSVPVTAIDFQCRTHGGNDALAVGTEDGRINICVVSADGSQVTQLPMAAELCLPKTVLQLAWSPSASTNELAIAGDDGSLRLYAFRNSHFQIEPASA